MKFAITLWSSAHDYEKNNQPPSSLKKLSMLLKKLVIGLLRNNFHMLAQGHTQGSTLQQRTNKTLTTDPFDNTCEANEVSPEVEAGGL
jgi:hypothetical protein